MKYIEKDDIDEKILLNDLFLKSDYDKMIKLKNDSDKIRKKKWYDARYVVDDYYFLTTRNKKIINRAYYKMWEIIIDYNFVSNKKKINVGALAEAPGGFVQALTNFRRNDDDKYLAITLKGDTKERIEWHKFKLKKENINFFYGNIKNDNGDLLNPRILKEYIEEAKKMGNLDIVTSDGGFELDSKYLNYKDIYHSKLFLSEIYLAVNTLKKGGNFVIKVYDLVSKISHDLFLILHKTFKNVDISKPLTSRPANSERYLVCMNFQGISDELNNKLTETIEKNNHTEKILVDIDFDLNKKVIDIISKSNEILFRQQNLYLEKINILSEKRELSILKNRSNFIKKKKSREWYSEYKSKKYSGLPF